eukprot:s3087_g5.t1
MNQRYYRVSFLLKHAINSTAQGMRNLASTRLPGYLDHLLLPRLFPKVGSTLESRMNRELVVCLKFTLVPMIWLDVHGPSVLNTRLYSCHRAKIPTPQHEAVCPRVGTTCRCRLCSESEPRQVWC